MFGRELKTEEEIIECAKELQKRGAVNVLVPWAGDGALLVQMMDIFIRKVSAKEQ